MAFDYLKDTDHIELKEKVSSLIPGEFPEFFRQDGKDLVNFFKTYYKLNSGRIWAGLSFRNSLEGAEFVRKYDDISGAEGTLMEQNLQLITPLFGIDYKDFVFSYNYSYQFGDVNFGSGGFHQITIGFNFLRGSIECDCF